LVDKWSKFCLNYFYKHGIITPIDTPAVLYFILYYSRFRDVSLPWKGRFGTFSWSFTPLPDEKLRLFSSLFISYDFQHYTHDDKIEVNDPAKLRGIAKRL